VGLHQGKGLVLHQEIPWEGFRRRRVRHLEATVGRPEVRRNRGLLRRRIKDLALPRNNR
jgi:hypothetical protein